MKMCYIRLKYTIYSKIMSLKYYLAVWLDEFNSRWTYHSCKSGTNGPICEDEVKVLKDISSCTPASDYLDEAYVNKMQKFLESGAMSEDIGEFARAAKLNAQVGKKWCVDIILVAISWTIQNGPGLIRDATIEALY